MGDRPICALIPGRHSIPLYASGWKPLLHAAAASNPSAHDMQSCTNSAALYYSLYYTLLDIPIREAESFSSHGIVIRVDGGEGEDAVDFRR